MLIGLDDYERKLKALALSVQQKMLIKEVKKAAKIIMEEMERRAPVDSGQLKESGKVQQITAESSASEAAVKVGPSMTGFYGLFQELGTAHHPAQPFLLPAFEDKKDEAFDMIRSGLKAAIDQFAKQNSAPSVPTGGGRQRDPKTGRFI